MLRWLANNVTCYTILCLDARRRTFLVLFQLIALAAHSGKHSVTVWRPSICLSGRDTYRDSSGGSMRRGQRTFRPDNKEDQHTSTCL